MKLRKQKQAFQYKIYTRLTSKVKQHIEQFFNSIIYFEHDGKVFDIKKTTFKLQRRNSNTWDHYNLNRSHKLKTVFEITVNGIPLKTKTQFDLKYKCLTCGKVNTIKNNTRLISKLLKDTIAYCIHCIQKNDFKMKQIRHDALVGKKVGEVKFARQRSVKEVKQFIDMPIAWQEHYFTTHYTEQQFWNMVKKNNIQHISNVAIDQIARFIPYFPSGNITQFASKIQLKDGSILPIYAVMSKCSKCGNEFSIHWGKNYTNTRKTTQICRQCMEFYFTNEKWKVREKQNCKGSVITSQSTVEDQFIDFCNEHDIEIVDGPVLRYFWNGKYRAYHVDFFVPMLDALIEIKAMHRFQREDIASGKFDAKCNVANEAVKQKKYASFEVVYDYQMTDKWKQKFLAKLQKV